MTAIYQNPMNKQIDPGLRPQISRALRDDDNLELQAGSRHARIVHKLSGDFIVVPGSAGDWRASRNLAAGLRRLSRYGVGLLAARCSRPSAGRGDSLFTTGR